MRSTLYARINSEDWPKRSLTGRIAGRSRGETRPGPDTAERTARLVARLFNALEVQMRDIERRLDARATRDAAARERDARTLASLVRTLEKLCALDAMSAAAGAAGDARSEPETVARMRQAIARRIAGLVPEGTG